MNDITKLEQLFVRACKSLKPRVRVHSVYRRFYGDVTSNPDVHIIMILGNLSDKFLPMSILEVMQKLDPSAPRYLNEYDYIAVCVDTLINNIRLSPMDSLPEMSTPAKFRRDES